MTNGVDAAPGAIVMGYAVIVTGPFGAVVGTPKWYSTEPPYADFTACTHKLNKIIPRTGLGRSTVRFMTTVNIVLFIGSVKAYL